MKRALLYSPVATRRYFSLMRFYRSDIRAMRAERWQVLLANDLWRVAFSRYDVMVGYFYTWSVFAAVIARLTGREAVLTGGADQFSPQLKLGRLSLLVRRCLLGLAVVVCNRLVLVSQADVQNVTRSVGALRRLAARKIVVAGHPLDEPSGLPVRFPEKSWRAATICWMGSESNVERKGLIPTIRFIGELKRLGCELPLVIIGAPGPGTRLVEEAIAATGVASHVTLAGAVSDVEKWRILCNSAVYFQLSEYEGFGVAALEALRCGCVVVHTGHGALDEVIGEEGLRVESSRLHDLGATFRQRVESKLASVRNRSDEELNRRNRRFLPEYRARALLLGETSPCSP